MSFDYQSQMPAEPISEHKMQEILANTMVRVYLWMGLGLVVTAVLAFFTLNFSPLLNFIFSNSFVYFGLFIVEIGLVVYLSRRVMKMSMGTGLAVFLFYAALNGITLSVIFLTYTASTITLAFSVTAVFFCVMSFIGFVTKEDLSKWRNVLFGGLIALIIASVANFFFANSTLDWIITYAGILLFLALTVYDTQHIKKMTIALASSGQQDLVLKASILGSLRLYLDFINLFLFILRLLGRRR